MPAQPPPASEAHQAAQSVLVGSLMADLASAWPALDPLHIKASMPRFAALVAALVRRYGMASASLAVSHYRQQRLAGGIAGRITVVPAAPAPVDQVEASLWTAVDSLYGPVTPETIAATQTNVEGVASRLAQDPGRQTIVNAVQADPSARGWARVTEMGACSFCLMLAIRAGSGGVLYYSKGSAGARANSRFVGAGDFKFHDHCECHVEPVFGRYEPTARVRAAERLWKDVTKGRSGRDARIAFRQAVEGRPVSGTSGPRPDAATLGLSRPQVEHQIALTEGLPDSAWRTRQLQRLRSLPV